MVNFFVQEVPSEARSFGSCASQSSAIIQHRCSGHLRNIITGASRLLGQRCLRYPKVDLALCLESLRVVVLRTWKRPLLGF